MADQDPGLWLLAKAWIRENAIPIVTGIIVGIVAALIVT